MSKIKLFCFPFAGGAASSYNVFKQYLSPEIEMNAIELAARGRRMREPNYTSIDGAVDDVFNIIRDNLSSGPYAFYGHSMGSMISFELAFRVLGAGLPMPVHIIFSGRAAPYISRENKRTLHHLSDDEFKRQLLEMGGTPKEFFEHPELLEVFLPLLKGDFTLTETYVHPPHNEKLDCNFTVLSGKQDEDTPEEVEAFREHTSGTCDIHYFEGDHFFIYDEPRKMMEIINNAVLASV